MGGGIAVDGQGSAYVTGRTGSDDYPTSLGAFDGTRNGDYDAFVTKLNGSGSGLAYSSFVGGTSLDAGAGIAVGGQGSAYVTGETFSADYPTTPGAFDPTKDGDVDAFVTKLNPSGSAPVYSTFLGGTGRDVGDGIAVDEQRRAYVTGQTFSAGYPTTPGAVNASYNGSGDAFVTKLNPSGSAPAYSTFLGGTSSEAGLGIAVDRAGVYVTGVTLSGDYPIVPGAFDPTFNGDRDAFVSKLADTTKAACVIAGTGTDSAGRKFLDVRTQDTDSGLAKIEMTNSINADTPIPSFTAGTTDPVILRATKVDQTKSSTVELRVTDVAGNVTVCDPVVTLVISQAGKPVAQIIRGVPRAEHKIAVTNGDPGISQLKITVNARSWRLSGLIARPERVLDVASAMHDGDNTIPQTARGKPGTSALVVISD